jgi:hypothetical protein
MKSLSKYLAIMVLIISVVAIVLGAVFVFQGFSKSNLIDERMKIEKVTIAVDPSNPQQLTQISTADDAMKAADTIAAHRRSLAPTYQDLLGTGKFDPTNQKHLTYAQAMNLENYLYMAVTAFGLIQVVLAAGVFMIITGIALGLTGLVLLQLVKRIP